MKKKITELTVKIPLVTEEDLLHNELNMYLLYSTFASEFLVF